MPLHTKYRKTKIEDIIGNDAIKEGLHSVLNRKKDFPHSYLFSGPSGCGKTTFAFILANELGISKLDVYYYNAANTRGIDTIRAIRNEIDLAPRDGKRKMYILDEVHQVTGVSQEALLLMLEEPPNHVFFTLCTTEPEKLKQTLRRRCHKYTVNSLSDSEIREYITNILIKEGVDDYPRTVLTKIITGAKGSIGEALNLLDSVIDVMSDKNAIDILEGVTYSEQQVKELCQALMDQTKATTKWNKIKGILANVKGEPEQIRYAIIGYMTVVMLNNGGKAEAEILSNFCDSFMYSGKGGLVLACYMSCL